MANKVCHSGLVSLALVFTACVGSVDSGETGADDPAAIADPTGDPGRAPSDRRVPDLGSSPAPTGGGGAGATTTLPSPTGGPPVLGPTTRFARLSHAQWETTVRDLLKLPAASGLSRTFTGDPSTSTFDNDSNLLQVTTGLWGDYQGSAAAGTPLAMKGTQMSEMPARARAFSDVILRAIACDATRVVTFMLDGSGGGGMSPYTFLPESTSDFHDVAHGVAPNFRGQHFAVRRWQMQQLAYLLKGLDSIREGNGTVLDNSLVLWINELGYNSWSYVAGGHNRQPTSSIIVGGCGGYFKTGRFVDVKKSSYHNLLLTVGQAMGVTDLTTFGQQGNTILDQLRA